MNAVKLLREIESRITSRSLDLANLLPEEQFSLIETRAVHITQPALLRQKLEEAQLTGKPLRVKYGIDPTGRQIHLGHIVPIIILRRLQQMGCQVVFLIGDFTAMIGDPSGRVTSRPILTREEILENQSTYEGQISHLLDISKTEIRRNSEWLETYPLIKFLRLLNTQTVSSAMQRDDFRNRESVSRAEILYSSVMAIDSIELEADIEVGGNDQFLNFMDTKKIMESFSLEPQVGITTLILQGTAGNGQKMSKSANNFVALNDEPEEIFGKIMSIPDSLMEEYFKLLTDISDEDWSQIDQMINLGQINPKIVKQTLGRIIVNLVYGSNDIALKAEASFEKTFSQHLIPDDIATFDVDRKELNDFIELLVKIRLVSSKNEARRLVAGRAVKLIIGTDVTVIMDIHFPLPSAKEFVLQVGKRRFAQIRLAEGGRHELSA